VIREDRELLAELARLNGDMAPLVMRIIDGSATAAEQQDHAQRLICAGQRLQRRAEQTGGVVIKGGRCRFCRWTWWGRRLWHRRPRCTVYRALDVALSQPMDVVWWQLLQSDGRDMTLAGTRKWLEQREQSAREPPAENKDADDDTVVLTRISD
jgi:hypothetical protein